MTSETTPIWVGYEIIFIGESVMSADVETKFTAADCVVIVSEPGNYDELLIGNYDSQYDTEHLINRCLLYGTGSGSLL